MAHAPVVMIAYNRPDQVRLTMRNVFLADGVETRDIFMYIDGPRSESDAAKQNVIYDIVSAYRKEFPRLHIVRREKNYGCRGNIVDAVSAVLSKFGSAIIVEDDILISRTFFRYMDNALDFYKDDARIWCVNAWRTRYIPVPRGYEKDVYLSRRNMCWGWGTWKDRWGKVDFDMKDWPNDRTDPDFMSRLDEAGYSLANMLSAQYEGRLKTWDVQCSYHMVKYGLFAVEPILPLTKNIGFSTASEHCGGANSAIATAYYYNFMPKLEAVAKEGDNEGLCLDSRILAKLKYSDVDPRFPFRIIRKFKRIWWGFGGEHNDPINV